MSPYQRERNVGLFMLVSAGMLGLLVMLAVGRRLLDRNRVRYLIHYEETVKGMVVGSPVNFQGVRVGTVADMRFAKGRTEVTIEVDPEKGPIQTCTRASLDRAWVTGQVTVELKGWEEGGEPLPELGVIPSELSPVALVARTLPGVMGRTETIFQEYAELGRRLNLLLGEENRERFSSILAGLDRNLARLEPLLVRLEDRGLPAMEEGLREAAALQGELRRALDPWVGFGKELKGLAGEMRAAGFAEILTANLARAGRAASAVDRFLGGNRRSLQRVLQALGGSLEEIASVLRMLRTTPSALVFGKPREPGASPPGGNEE